MMSNIAAKLIFTLTVCSLVSACGAGYEPDNETGVEAPTAPVINNTNATNTPAQAPLIAAGSAEIEPEPTVVEQPTGSTQITDTVDEYKPEVELGAASSSGTDTTAGTGINVELPTTPVVGTFNVTLVSVDVRRTHNGEPIEVDVDEIDSGPLHMSLSE